MMLVSLVFSFKFPFPLVSTIISFEFFLFFFAEEFKGSMYA